MPTVHKVQRINVSGTSGANAFVAGTVLKNWCVNPEKTSLDIISDIKAEMSFSASMDTAKTLTLTKEYDITFDKKDNIMSTIAELNARSLDEGVSVLCVGDDCDDGCYSNDMASAISLPFLNWRMQVEFIPTVVPVGILFIHKVL